MPAFGPAGGAPGALGIHRVERADSRIKLLARMLASQLRRPGRWHTHRDEKAGTLRLEDTAMGALDELPLLTRHRLTVADCYRMAEAGVLGPQARVELIDGEVIDRAPIGSRHHAAVLRLSRQLQFAVGDHALVSVQGPLSLGEFSQPEPDLMLLQTRAHFYAAAHPVATDVPRLIEVADTSARYDREIKLPLTPAMA